MALKDSAMRATTPGLATVQPHGAIRMATFGCLAGMGQDVNNTVGYLNDLWKYNLDCPGWMWMKGSTTADAIGVYGTKGVAASGDTSGARQDSTGLLGPSDGLLWMLGGLSGSTFYQDVWTFDIYGSANWTWMSGSNLGNQPGIYGTPKKGLLARPTFPGHVAQCLAGLI